MTTIEIMHGDITKIKVDAIVNAAHTSLLGGGGVDGAIHRTAGSGLRLECSKLNGCVTGQAKITSGYNLPVKYVIHTVGPIWSLPNLDQNTKIKLLHACYYNSLKLASEHDIRTIAFPTISCGAYRCPIDIAVDIALKTTINFIQQNDGFERIIFIDIKKEIVEKYKELLNYYLNK